MPSERPAHGAEDDPSLLVGVRFQQVVVSRHVIGGQVGGEPVDLCDHQSAWGRAGILGRQGRRTARGLSYTASRVQSLRHHWGIDRHQQNTDAKDGELVTVAQAATAPGLAPSTLHRWLGDGFIAGEQTTPGESGSTTPCARCSSTTPPPATWPCSRRPWHTECPARRCCSVSSAANSKPSTRAPDDEKACVSNPRPPRKDCFDHDNQRKEQCDDASKQSAMSVSTNQVVPVQVLATSRSAVWQPRPGRNPWERSENVGS
jgi:hypothetical protein